MANERVLFVDDEKNVRLLVEMSLSRSGYHVTTVASGQEALALMQEQAFDVMLTDLKMPEMSGEELLGQVRTLWPDLEVVVVTAYPGLSNAIRTIRAGVSDYVLKPFDLNQLELAVRRCIERKQLRLALQHEQQLRHQYEELSQIRSELVATLANEIQTPVRTILDAIELLRKNNIQREDEETKFVLERQGLEQIATGVARMMESLQRLQLL
jgi:DNA-binding NtrC family response regulator